MLKVWAAPEFVHYAEDFHMSPAIEASGFVLLSGQTGVRPDNTISDVPETQMREAFLFLERNLGAGGLELRHIVELTTYHVGLRTHLDTFNKVKDEFIRAPYPAWTAIGVSELWTIGSIIELRAIACAGR
jgi:enamine deaminase RidA (YjgF/YER057c/UK114 family)